jgi:phosphatidylserine/phosphatidylglycerophosphate/cardiolipin synthase-like enzyme
VQVARTYIRTADPSTALPFAPGGDRTIHDTLLRAIVAAREFIYIEDQYFAPPIAAPDGLALPQPKYGNVLVDKVRNGAIKRLVVTVPGVTDQPFGDVARSGFISDLQSADEGRGIVRIGYPRRHYTLPDNDLRASSGRCLLTESVPAEGETVCLGPKTRLPSVPFWLAVEGELMYVNDVARPGLWPPPPADSARFLAVRGSATQLVRGGVAPVGTRQRQHFAGAAATVVDLTPIYVDAKLMIVDDVFLSLGSASLSRRSLFHDGELTTFTMPEALRAASDNPVRDLRVRLWAEMLNLPPALAAPLLADPVAAAALFDRSPLRGNRYTDITGFPERAVASASGESILSIILGRLGVLHVSIGWDELFDTVIDPTSTLEL